MCLRVDDVEDMWWAMGCRCGVMSMNIIGISHVGLTGQNYISQRKH